MDKAFEWVRENGVHADEDDPYVCEDSEASKCRRMECSTCRKLTGEKCPLGNCTMVPGSACRKTSKRSGNCECTTKKCFTGGHVTGDAACIPVNEVQKGNLVLAVGEVVGYTRVHPFDKNALEAAVAQQPVAVAIEAASTIMHYKKGIIASEACGSKLDHAVLVVGYGVSRGVKYWKVKNTFGKNYGENGYLRIERGRGGECGLRLMASFPTLKNLSDVIVV